MKLLRNGRRADRAGAERRGAALLLSLLILLVLVAIVIQINVSTSTDARVARNDVGLTTIDQAVESALLQVYDQLETDGAADAASSGGAAGAPGAAGGAGAPGAPGAAGAAPGAAPGAPGGEQQQPTDSRRDEWARPQKTDINEIKLRIFVQDEDSKINVLTMLNPDEKEAQAAYERVARCLDLCREGTSLDIDNRTADEMAKTMLEYMTRRNLAKQPRPTLLSDDPQNEDRGMPLSLREFAVLPPFDESHFRDLLDEEGRIVHSIGAYLTVWSSLTTLADVPSAAPPGSNVPVGGAGQGQGGQNGQSGQGQNGQNGQNGQGQGGQNGSGQGGASGGQGAAGGAASGAGTEGPSQTSGFGVNVNTAPPAVLKALFDDRVVHPRFWDNVIEHRNLEEEKEPGAEEEDVEPQLDEYGEEIIERRIFDSLAEVADIDGFREFEPPLQAQINQLLTVDSRVFSIYVVARRTTSLEGDLPPELAGRPARGTEDQKGDALVRVIRSVVWRHESGDETVITPIVRWEVLDYVPYEVLDYPEEED